MQSNAYPIRQNRLANLLIDASPIAMVMTDAQGTIVLVNRIAESWFGYLEDELVGRSLETLVPDDYRSAHVSQRACFMSQTRARPMAEGRRVQAKRKDGTLFPVQVTLHPLTIGADQMILANVTNLGANPDEEKRIQGEKLAGILEMTTGLTHETNNALQRARSCLDLLQMDLSHNPELMNLTDRIREALQDLHKNFEEVKNYAAPIKLKLSRRINLGQLCQTVFDELTESSNIQHSLSIKTDQSYGRLCIDVPRIGQALRAVLSNALAASPTGAKIEFSCQTSGASSGQSIEIIIRDYGPGFCENIANRLFEPFFTTKQRGTGLGLAVCRRVVEAHDGTITAENHPAGGVLVRITMPYEPCGG
ncbi:two-component system sensor histidine kinase NtrB [Aureliella helgolandensis]|uniref:histidine kinase n=1 Tax=Aureliella helgolandensis TaxID=2527968 RepID=A0A518GD25_9BACT|nr:ATP-binding protein [Aureliella helgolandensis]QDV26467.1 Sensor protein FixL [Aureliella helgolandensis]